MFALRYVGSCHIDRAMLKEKKTFGSLVVNIVVSALVINNDSGIACIIPVAPIPQKGA